ncbi:MAG: hypothetical protein J6X22_09565 [Muribaculaceae bacterium]|nr:hypothetical protein [Muribaculaceae bacterium]
MEEFFNKYEQRVEVVVGYNETLLKHLISKVMQRGINCQVSVTNNDADEGYIAVVTYYVKKD